MTAEQDFRQFVAGRQRALLRSAWLLTGDWSAAEDLVQTALMRSWPKWRRLTADDAAEAYVRRVMFNAFATARRRRWHQEIPTGVLPERPASGPDSDPSEAADLRRMLVAAVQALPPRQRAVVVLRFFDDLTETQTAAVLGVAVGTVKSQTAKALTSLRRQPQLAGIGSQEGMA